MATAATAASIRAAFERAGYDEERIAAALRVDRPVRGSSARANVRRLAAGDPLGTLVRLFMVGEIVGRDALAAVIDVDEAAAAGLVELDGDDATAPFAVVEWQGLLVAHDHEGAAVASDHVTGISNATRTLAALTVRRAVRRALDLGTGCGVQAMLAARHADEVVATDVTDRALRVAELNLKVNDVRNVELRRGSLFEPVAGEQFDLIATNPPFVVSPDAELVFRDGGLERDDISRRVVEGAAEHLAPGGYASMLVCWVHDQDADWRETPRAWVSGSGCDALVVRYVTEDALAYAVKWAGDADVDRWLAYYRSAGIEALTTGGVVLRKRSDGDDNGWFAALDAETGPTGPASAQLERIFAARDARRDLRDERLRLAPHTLDERLVWAGDGYAPQRLALRLHDGIGVEVAVEPRALPALFALDGSKPVRELPDAEAALPTIRRLWDAGFVERAEVGDPGFEPGTSALSERRSNQLS